MTYDPSKWFFSERVRTETEPEPRPFTYRPRTFADVAVRLSQNYKGVPTTARRDAADTICIRCGVDRANHGRKKNAPNPFRACPRFASPWPRKSSTRKGTMQQNSESEEKTPCSESLEEAR